MDTNEAAKKVADASAKAEAKVDEVVGKVTKKAQEVIPEKAKVTAQDVAHTAERASKKVDEIAGQIDDFTDSILPEQKGTDVIIKPDWQENVSRVFIFRLLWILVQYPIIFVWSIAIGIITLIHYIYMLVVGKRNIWMRGAQARYYRHATKWGMYVSGVIDRRPELIER